MFAFSLTVPSALTGFLLSLTPLSMDLMGWRGVPPTGAAGIGCYIGFGGLLMLLGAIGEWILGNTFPCVVFGSFGSFWIALAITLMPSSGAASSYGPKASEEPGFENSWGTSIAVRLLCGCPLNLHRFLLGLHGCSSHDLLDLRPPHQLGPLLDPLPPHSRFLPLDCWLLPPCSWPHLHGHCLHHCWRCFHIRDLHARLVHLRRHSARIGRLPAFSSR